MKAEVASLRGQQLRTESDGANKAQEDARLARAKADKAEMEARAMRGDLVPVEQIGEAMHSAVTVMKTRMLALPAKAAPLAHAAPTIAAAESVIREQVEEALVELSQTEVVGTKSDGSGAAASAN